MEEEQYIKNSDGLEVALYYNNVSGQQDSELVIILHAFGSNKEGASKHIMRELDSVGKSTLAIDFDNVGNSELPFEQASVSNYLKSVEAAIDFGKGEGFEKISLVGSSFGGLVALATAYKHPEIERLFLRAPAIDFSQRAQEYYETAKEQGYFEFPDRHGVQRKIGVECFEDANNYVMRGRLGELEANSIYIVHGDEDYSISVDSSIKAMGENPRIKVEIIEGADHYMSVGGDYSATNVSLKKFFSQPLN